MKGKIRYFGTDGIRQKADAFTPGFIQAITLGIVRYLGNARETADGMERPVKVLLGRLNGFYATLKRPSKPSASIMAM